MSYALVAHTFFKGAQFGGTTPPIDTTGANLIVLGVIWSHHTGDTPPFDSKANVWTPLSAQDDFQEAVRLWYCYNPTVGTLHTFSTTSATPAFEGVYVAAFSGSTANPFNVESGSHTLDNNNSFQPGPLTPSENNSLIMVACANECGSAFSSVQSIDSGFTITDSIGENSATNFGGGLAYKIQTSSATVNPTWSATGAPSGFAIVMATFFSASSPPPPPANPAWTYSTIWAMRNPAIPIPTISITLGSIAAAASSSPLAIASHNATLTLQSVIAAPVAEPLTVQGATNTSITLSGASAVSAIAAIAITNSPNVSLQSVAAAGAEAALTIVNGTSVALGSVLGTANASAVSVQITVSLVSLASVSAGSSAASIGVTGSATVTTLIVANDAGITAPAGAISHVFGHKFEEGDITTFPDFRLQDGTAIPYSMSLTAYSLFSPTDGSLWDASFMLRMPNAIPASFTATVTTTSGSTTATMTSTASLAKYMGIFGTNISIRPTGVASITNGTTFELTRNAIKTGSFTATFNGVLVNVKKNGAGPGTCSRSISDAPAIKNTWVYQNGGSGIAVCALSYASTNPRADDYQFMSGAVGNCYVYPTAQYRSSGVNDPLLNAHMTIYVLEDQSANLYGVRELIMPSNGFADVAGNTWKSATSVITDDGLGHSFDCYDVTTIGSTRPVNAATVGSNTFTLTSGTGFDGGELVQVGGPSPPSPLVIGNFYWVQKVGTSTFQLSNGSAQGTSRIAATTTGGTWTVTAYPWLVPFGTQSDAGPTARPRFYQGSGSVAADAVLRIYKDPYYMRSTGFYPSFDCEGADYQHSGTRPVASTKTSTYFWGTSQPLGQRSLGGVSPEPTGYDLWSSNDFFNQTTTTKRITAMAPLIGCQFGIRMRSGQSATRGRCIPVNNGTNNSGTLYANMPAFAPKFSYSTTTGGVNFPSPGTAPTPIAALLPGFDAQGFDHWFAWFTGAVDTFREPHMLDWMIDDANHALFERGNNSGTPGVNHYSATQWAPSGVKYCNNAGFGINRYCINMGSQLQNGRYDAWAWRTHMHAAVRIPIGYAEYPYLHDSADDGIANLVEILANQATNPIASSTGFWLKGPTNFFFDGWQIAYYGMGVGPAGNYVKFNPNALVGMNQTLKFCTNIVKIMGYPLGYAQEQPISAASTAPTGPLIADTSLLAGESMTLSWMAGSSVFTWVNFSTNTLHTQGTYDYTKSIVGSADYYIFTLVSPPSESIRTPGGGTEMIKYYVNPLSPSTCELHRLADFSDAAFVPTDTNQTTSWFRVVDYSTKLVFPAAFNIKDQFYNTIWDAVATALAWGQTGGDPIGQAMWTSSWQACLNAGLLNQSTQGDGPNYLNTVL